MENRRRSAVYAGLWVLALAFGWIEASVVVYLREIAVRELSLQPAISSGLQVTLVSIPSHLVAVEMAREACTILLLAAVAWLAGVRAADRAGAFLIAFGVWDLTYYAALEVALGWPDTLRAWDVLFLIPAPWVAPVWAPMVVAALFVASGTYLFWTADRERRYRWLDAGVLAASALLTIASFLVESKAVIDHRVPERFAVWQFWAGVALGVAGLAAVERRAVVRTGAREPWVGVRVRTILPDALAAQTTPATDAPARAIGSSTAEDADVGSVIREYMRARRRLDTLENHAREVAERLERLARGLTIHPARIIIGIPDERLDAEGEWDVMPSRPLPQIEGLAKLTEEIREAAAKVDVLRERLILRGRGDVVEQRDEFFH